jgi:hypothetical protein
MKLGLDPRQQGAVIICAEPMEKLAQTTVFLRSPEAQETTFRSPKQHPHVRKLTRKWFVDVSQKTETVALCAVPSVALLIG